MGYDTSPRDGRCRAPGGANNRVDQYAYDAAGDVTGDGVHSYTYDAENRLVSVDGGSTATYVYDALGRRVEKTTSAGSVYYLYDLAGNVVTELSATGDWNRVEIYAAGKHVATYSGGASGTTYFDHADWLGTERARTDAQGEMTETCTSLAFGDDLSCSGTDASPLHFTGKQRDNETGLDDFGARYYGSGAGRFMSSDWSSVPVAIPYADLTNPQTLNLYILVRDNPESFADLDGHCPPGQNCDPDTTGWQRPFSKTGEPHAQKPGDGLPVSPTQQAQTAQQRNEKEEAVNDAYRAACSNSAQGCTSGQNVRLRMVGGIPNVQIPGDPVSPRAKNTGIKELSFFRKLFHPRARGSYFMTSFSGLFGRRVPHVVDRPGGVEAHIDPYGPLNPLHLASAFRALFVDTRKRAGPGLAEVCSPSGGCQ